MAVLPQPGRPPFTPRYSVDDVVSGYGIPAEVVRVELKTGRLRGKKAPDGLWVIRRTDLKRWIRSPRGLELLERFASRAQGDTP